MIRYSTSRIHKGSNVSKGDLVTDCTNRELQRLLDCGQAYEELVDESSKVKDIKLYLDYHGKEYSSDATKSELLELL